MAQESPTRLLYAQASQLIKQLQLAYGTSKNQTTDEIAFSISNTLSRFFETAGHTQTMYEPVRLSEVPGSAKMNRFWTSLQNDVNILQDQIDILKASTIFSHNFIKTEILKAQRENSRIHNKIKTLELYSSIDNDSLVYFGDNFITEDFIDWNLVPSYERATLVGSRHLSLHAGQQQSAITSKTSITILNGSNGFIGNNQEILDPNQSTSNPSNDEKNYTFMAEINRNANLGNLLDSKPNTCVEFEKYYISPENRAKAKDYNFAYVLTDDPKNSYFSKATATINEKAVGSKVNWADGPENNTLTFSFEIDLSNDQQINIITLLPYGLVDNKNNPIKIVSVATSLNKTDWTVLGPENVWISNSIDKKISSVNAENIIVGSATWVTDGSAVRFIRFIIEQPNPIDCNIGHLYYLTKDAADVDTPPGDLSYPVATNITYGQAMPYDASALYGGTSQSASQYNTGYNNATISEGGCYAPSKKSQAPPIIDADYRVEGPNPPVNNPQFYLDPKNSKVNDLIQKREYFTGKRWAIGLRDVSIAKYGYDTKGVIISKKFNIPGIVDRISIDADIFIPDSYDRSINWISFFVSPDDGLTWFQISRIQDDFLNLPEIIAFNDPTPIDLREPGVAYFDVKGTVDSLRVKIEITRPSNNDTSTPVVHSYKLKVVKRD